MENKQINNQEKPFDDKRAVVDKDPTTMYPKMITTSRAIDEACKFDTEAFKRYMQRQLYGTLNGGFVYTDDGKSVNNFDKPEPKDETPEEWIWVDGYKGTDADMKCMCEYQYVMGKQFDMPEGSTIEDCKSGFHLCLNLDDVFRYKTIGNGNRFFRVHALVRKKDFEEYGTTRTGYGAFYSVYAPVARRNKLVAKSIVFVRELTNDEVFKGTDAENWPEEDKNKARAMGIQKVKDIHKVDTLVSLGYSEAFAEYIVGEDHYQAAYAAGTQKDLSMDMKVAYIMRNEC